MRIFLIVFSLSLSLFAEQQQQFTYRQDLSANIMSSTFPNKPQLTGPASGIAWVDMWSTSASEFEINCQSSTQPLSKPGDINGGVPNGPGFSLPPNGSYSPNRNTLIAKPFGNVCWIRSVTGSASSGVLELTAWGY